MNPGSFLNDALETRISLPRTAQSDLQKARRPTLKAVNFYCLAPAAAAVQLIGSFNHWDPLAHPMTRRVDGCWFLQLLLPHGHHTYQFLADGEATLDPTAMGTAHNSSRGKVSLLAVS